MGGVKQINTKNRNYFYNNMINKKIFVPILLKINKKSYKNIDSYNIGYITNKKKIDDCETIYCENLLYLLINHANGYIKEKNKNKYLIFESTVENKELLKKYNDVWRE